MNPLVLSTALAAATCFLVARWRLRADLPHARLEPNALQGLLDLKRIAKEPDSSDELRQAVDAVDQVTQKLLDAIDLEGKLRGGAHARRAEPSARQALVLSRVQAELGRFSNVISNILGDATVNSLPVCMHACMCRYPCMHVWTYVLTYVCSLRGGCGVAASLPRWPSTLEAR